MTKKRAPYLFLGLLIVILFFILGFRAGQQIELADKRASVLLSLSPSATVAPSAKPLSFATLEAEGCGITLLYPESLTLATQGTQSAQFTEKGHPVLNISCAVWAKPQPTSIPVKQSDTIGGRPLSVTKETDNAVSFLVKHPTKNILVTVEAEKTLYPFILQNLNFVK